VGKLSPSNLGIFLTVSAMCVKQILWSVK